jgi:formate-dependent nitrite reductase membrane component NrfD
MRRMKMAATIKLNPQRSWDWKIAAYLFLAGVGAGAALVGAVAHLLSPSFTPLMQTGLWIGIPLVVVGILFLMWDLGQPTKFTKALNKPGTSWIARGSWILTVFLVLSVVLFGLWIWPFTVLGTMPGAITALEVLIAVFALGTVVYTGLLLGASKPIPFWSMPTLPLLFSVSATATGMKASSLLLTLDSLMRGTPLPDIIATLARYIAIVIALEIAVVVLHLWGTHQTVTAKFSTLRVLRGPLATQFWLGYVVLGLIIPLLAETLVPGAGAGSEALWIMVAAALGLIGGFILRLTVVSAGAKTPLPAMGGEIAIPANM